MTLTRAEDTVEQILAWQRQVLRKLASGEPLQDILDALCRFGNARQQDRMYSVLLVSGDGGRLVDGAGPNLPPAYRKAIDGIPIAPGAGSCGTAAHTRRPVVVSDVQKDPLWKDFRHLAQEHGFAACWSSPILGSDDTLLGTWAIYSRTPGLPTEHDQHLIEAATGLAAVAIERHRAEAERERTIRMLRDESQLNERLSRLGGRMAAELDEQRLAQLVTDEATAMAEAAFGAFFFNVRREDGEAYTLYTLAGARREDFARFPMPRKSRVFAPTFDGERTVRLDDVTRSEAYGHNAPHQGIPAGHLPVRSYLAVPVKSRQGEVLGGLFLGHPEPGRFDERHQRAVEIVAGLAAVAMHNARLYRELRRSEEEARQAYQRAAAADRRKDEFLAMLGHELRNPLSPILTALSLQRMREPTPNRERDIIQRQVDHLVRLVDDLLDVSRITRGLIELRRHPTELADAVARGVEMAQPLLEARRHSLQVVAPRGLVVDADEARLAQVVANLLTNAAKYTPAEGDIRLRCSGDERHVELEVRDNGVGIERALLPHVFDLFVQGPQPTERPHGGLGLGLPIVKSLVGMHGGEVTAHSDGIGKGSTFRVRLPRAHPATAPASPSDPRRAPAPGAKVLVVDDNADVADTLAEWAQELGWTTRVARDGPSAVAAAREFRPDTVLLDIGLPVMDGHEVARQLRREHGSTMRIITISGYGQDADRERSREAGVDLHLVKPVQPQVLTDLLRLPARGA
ncbi:MAG TPA: GAF domain-containing protein [Candidatus Thermoplasmatota archaeon]|nr:GAF domain-containing protein [Candidatus Thermoplasmatota archaeon]